MWGRLRLLGGPWRRLRATMGGHDSLSHDPAAPGAVHESLYASLHTTSVAARVRLRSEVLRVAPLGHGDRWVVAWRREDGEVEEAFEGSNLGVTPPPSPDLLAGHDGDGSAGLGRRRICCCPWLPSLLGCCLWQPASTAIPWSV